MLNASALLITIPASCALAFIVLFLVNFYSQVFVDRIRAPQDVLIDFGAKSITWKSWKGTHHRSLKQLEGISVELIGEPVESTGVSISLQFCKDRITILETSKYCQSVEATHQLLVPFATALSNSLGVTVTNASPKFEQLVIAQKRSWILIFMLSCLAATCLVQILNQAIGSSNIAWISILNLIWLLPCIGLNLGFITKTSLNRVASVGTRRTWRGTQEFDLKQISQVEIHKTRIRDNGLGYRYQYKAVLVAADNQGHSNIVLESNSRPYRVVLIAFRVASFLNVPIDDPFGAIRESKDSMEHLV